MPRRTSTSSFARAIASRRERGHVSSSRRAQNVGTSDHRRTDWTFIAMLSVIILFGLVMLTSASAVLSFQRYGDSYYLLKHQLLFGVLLGALACYLFAHIDYHYWRKQAFPLMVVTAITLFFVFVPGFGVELLGAKRWISIGGFFFQPSELVKMTFLLYLAAWLEKRGKEVEDATYGFLSFLVMLGFLVAMIAIAQKDLGTTIVISCISIVVYFVAGAPWKHLIWIVLLGIAAVGGLILLEPYRAGRLTVFLNPDADPQGIGYHVNQALIAIGSGGLFGVGFGHSRQKFNYLPEVATDSIFAIIAEELGFLFALLVIVLFLIFTLHAIRIARHAPDQFGKLVGIGIATWIGFQAFVNIGAMLSLLPLTGIPLPFISYGSSSLITLCAAAGILINIAKQSRIV